MLKAMVDTSQHDSNGTLLWVRNPFEEAGLGPYRSPRPVIYDIQMAEMPRGYAAHPTGSAGTRFKSLGMDPAHEFVKISFDSSQFGLVDETSGSFLLEGQN
jgi:hypothetical protein